MRYPSLAATLALLLAAQTARAEDAAATLTRFETEMRALGANLPRPNEMTTAVGQRRLVDAQVAFASGNYDSAALILFDLAAKSQGADKETATFYLGETLFQKGDRGSARTYFQAVVQTGPSSRYYQPSAMRLVEIAIDQKDTAGADEALRQLDSTPRSTYVRGKHAFATGKYPEAIGYFASVAKGSDQELQALYYSAAASVAANDLAKATDLFADLVTRTPRSNTDRRVIELAQLALGRIYYERDQASKSIDAYLLVDRHSDLFPTALYEVAWVYVKSKQYDKALVALELLNSLDPQSTNTPTHRILEGNLRIRKAQLLRQAEINGTINKNVTSDPPAEYAKAEKIFTETHDQYSPSYNALSRMVAGALDPASFIDQVSGRSTRVFQQTAPIPEMAAQWLREQPEVQRVVSVENDLAEIASNIRQSEAMISQLEAALATGDRLRLYPALSQRRMRIGTIQHELIQMRNTLAEQKLKGGGGNAATTSRRSLAAQYAALGNPERAHTDRTAVSLQGYDKLDSSLEDIQRDLTSTQAIAVALRKYSLDVDLTAEQAERLKNELAASTAEAKEIEDDLSSMRADVVLGRELAPTGDQQLLAARTLRAEVRAAQDAEQRAIGGSALADRAMKLAETLDQVDAQIDRLVTQGLAEAKTMLDQERAKLVEFKKLLAEYESEARRVGSEVLSGSFKDVKDMLYDVVIRTDVGNVDVAWSRKEDSDDDYRRLNLARSRDLKQLRDEFKFVLDQVTPPPGPAKTSEPEGAPVEGQPTSPDQGKLDERVKPAGDPSRTNQPVVKPDTKGAPQPKKGTP